MFGYVYITTNLVNGKKYIGQHRYNKPEVDPYYLGSGKILEQAILKEGRHNFRCAIVEICDSQKELDERESYWIEYYDAVNSEEFYNIIPGGTGMREGFKMPKDAVCKMKKSHTGLVRINNGNSERIVKPEIVEDFLSKGWKLGCKNDYWKKDAFKDCKGDKNPMYGRKHSKETRRILSEKATGRTAWNKGKVGTTKGTVWITNIHTSQSRMVKSPELEILLKSGNWRRGRS